MGHTASCLFTALKKQGTLSHCPNLLTYGLTMSQFTHCLTVLRLAGSLCPHLHTVSQKMLFLNHDLGVAAWMLKINFFGHISLASFLLTSYFGTKVTSSLKLFCSTHHHTEASNNTLWHDNVRTLITNFNQQIN